MRIFAPSVVAAGLLAWGLATAVPADAATTVKPAVSSAPAAAAACPLDAKSAAKSAGVIADVVVRHPARKAADGTLTLPVRIDGVFKGRATKTPVTLVVTGTGCAAKIIQQAKPKDVLLVLGTLHGTQLRLSGASPSVLVDDQACRVEKVLGKACTDASSRVVFADLSAGRPEQWLKVAAPGLAAIIVAVLGLVLLRLRRR